jgi:hypothetical protein
LLRGPLAEELVFSFRHTPILFRAL